MLLEVILKRDRALMLTSLVAITVLAWGYIFYLAWRMSQAMSPTEMGMSGMTSASMAMPQLASWTAVDFGLTLVMWVVMMVAMMTPTAAPMMLSYAKICRQRYPQQGIIGPTSLFVLSYFVVWTGFSVLATLLQWLLHRLTLLSPMMGISSVVLGSALLIGAGAFQFSALKDRCLRHCRLPFTFFLHEWREGAVGALQMGAKHGLFCLGCCWILMLLLFVAGVMNLLWVALLALLVLLEKVLPTGILVSRIAGVGFILWGIGLLLTLWFLG